MQWQGTWQGANSYSSGDVVSHGGDCYIAGTAIGAGFTPSPAGNGPWEIMARRGDAGLNWRGAWVDAIPYVKGDVVRSGAALFRATTAIQPNMPPDPASGEWARLLDLLPPLNWRGAWNASDSYSPNDVVQVDLGGGKVNGYVCVETNSAQEPPNATYWRNYSAEETRNAEFFFSAIASSTSGLLSLGLAIWDIYKLSKGELEEAVTAATAATQTANGLTQQLQQRIDQNIRTKADTVQRDVDAARDRVTPETTTDLADQTETLMQEIEAIATDLQEVAARARSANRRRTRRNTSLNSAGPRIDAALAESEALAGSIETLLSTYRN